MNTNALHNILNVIIALIGLLTAVLIATGCAALPTGALDCRASWISPEVTAIAVAVLAVLKTLINILRDGLGGLTKPQPPVRR